MSLHSRGNGGECHRMRKGEGVLQSHFAADAVHSAATKQGYRSIMPCKAAISGRRPVIRVVSLAGGAASSNDIRPRSMFSAIVLGGRCRETFDLV